MVEQFMGTCVGDLEDYRFHFEGIKVPFNPVNREDFLRERFPCHYFTAAANPAIVAILRVNLPSPSTVTVAGCTDKYMGVKITEMEALQRYSSFEGHE